MSNFNEAFMNPLNFGSALQEIPNNSKDFYAKLISDFIWKMFYMKDGAYDHNSLKNMKLGQDDYNEYRLECWKNYKMKKKFKNKLIYYLEKKGFYVMNASVKNIVRGPSEYLTVGDDYEQVVYIIGPYSCPVIEYPQK